MKVNQVVKQPKHTVSPNGRIGPENRTAAVSPEPRPDAFSAPPGLVRTRLHITTDRTLRPVSGLLNIGSPPYHLSYHTSSRSQPTIYLFRFFFHGSPSAQGSFSPPLLPPPPLSGLPRVLSRTLQSSQRRATATFVWLGPAPRQLVPNCGQLSKRLKERWPQVYRLSSWLHILPFHSWTLLKEKKGSFDRRERRLC